VGTAARRRGSSSGPPDMLTGGTDFRERYAREREAGLTSWPGSVRFKRWQVQNRQMTSTMLADEHGSHAGALQHLHGSFPLRPRAAGLLRRSLGFVTSPAGRSSLARDLGALLGGHFGHACFGAALAECRRVNVFSLCHHSYAKRRAVALTQDKHSHSQTDELGGEVIQAQS
jgi:hypothetical protein